MRDLSHSRSLFASNSSLHLKLILCLGASLALLALENRGETTAHRLPLAAVVDPIRSLVNTPVRLIRQLSADKVEATDLAAENQRLREEALLLRGRQLKFEALEQENTRLRGLLDSTFKIGEQVMIAEPLAINIVPYENLIAVNKGSRHGIKPGQAVIDGNGVVGQVLRVTPNNADVVMITDPSHAIPVQVNRSGLRTVAMGTGNSDRLDLPFLAGSADIRAGDLLVTSGMGGGFPAGYPVARMVSVTEGPGTASRLRAEPLARLDHNRELLIVHSDSTPISRIPHSSASSENPETHAVR